MKILEGTLHSHSDECFMDVNVSVNVKTTVQRPKSIQVVEKVHSV